MSSNSRPFHFLSAFPQMSQFLLTECFLCLKLLFQSSDVIITTKSLVRSPATFFHKPHLLVRQSLAGFSDTLYLYVHKQTQ